MIGLLLQLAGRALAGVRAARREKADQALIAARAEYLEAQAERERAATMSEINDSALEQLREMRAELAATRAELADSRERIEGLEASVMGYRQEIARIQRECAENARRDEARIDDLTAEVERLRGLIETDDLAIRPSRTPAP